MQLVTAHVLFSFLQIVRSWYDRRTHAVCQRMVQWPRSGAQVCNHWMLVDDSLVESLLWPHEQDHQNIYRKELIILGLSGGGNLS